jgi:spore maturation protein CgeB
MYEGVILYIGSNYQGSNDIVNQMRLALSRMPGVKVVSFDPGLYEQPSSRYVFEQGKVNWLMNHVVERLVEQHHPDTIICVAGGLSLTIEMHQKLAAQGVTRIGIALSDPDDFTSRSKYFAPYFDLFYTNALESLSSYKEIGVDARLLPFAANPFFHRPLRVPQPYDVVIVGGSRPDRVEMVKAMRFRGLRVKCHGRGWRHRWLVKLGFSTEVHGSEQVAAINSGKLYLSFAATVAGFTNVKVGLFEAAACAACILVQDFPELHNYFEPGTEIVTYTSQDNAIAKARHFSRNPDEAYQIGLAAYARFLSEHTWWHRWHAVLTDLVRAYPSTS